MVHRDATVDDLKEWLRSHWVTFASSSGLGSNKRMEVSMTGEYRVTEAGNIAYIGTDKNEAIGAYNALR